LSIELIHALPRADVPRILVVEDEVLVRLMIADELRARGFAVVETANADEALQVLRSSIHVDLVLTDLQMPGRMDGLGLAQVLNENRPYLKVILASAHHSRADAPDNIIAQLQKPYDMNRIVRVVHDALI
jgi:two-component system, response regulator PdtaR